MMVSLVCCPLLVSSIWTLPTTLWHATPPSLPPTIEISYETTRVPGPLRADGSVDYLAALDQRCRRGVKPAENAAVLLCEAMGPASLDEGDPKEFFRRLGIEPLPEKGPYFVALNDYLARQGKRQKELATKGLPNAWDRFGSARERPWTRKEFPRLAEWLDANAEPLDKVVEAAGRRKYYEPLLPCDEPALLTAPLYTTQFARIAAQALTARAMFRLGEGRIDDAEKDILAIWRLGRLIGQVPVMAHLTAASLIESWAFDATAALIEAAPLGAERARQLGKALAALPPPPSLAKALDLGERLIMLDVVDALARGGPAALSNVLAWRDWASDEQPDGRDPRNHRNGLPRRWLVNWTVHWDDMARGVNRLYDRLVKIARMPSHADRAAGMQWYLDGTKKVSEYANQQRWTFNIPAFCGVLPPWADWEEMIALVTALLHPPHDVANIFATWAQSQYRVAMVAIALEAYRAAEGAYPDRLAQLRAGYVIDPPIDPFSGQELGYRREKDGFVLYSVGINMQDDKGRTSEDPTEGDIALRVSR